MTVGLWAGTARARVASTQPTPFLVQVRENFAKWDANHDGVLSPEEIERAVDNPEVKGSAAAAAATLRRAIHLYPSILPVTLDRLAADAPDPKSGKPPAYQALYAGALARITTTPRDLFVLGLPHAETLGQGRLGDCFLLAPLGTMAALEPARLKQMIAPTSEGPVKVAFGNGQTLTLPLPTDAEIALGAHTSSDGIWANVFEKAIGQIYLDRQKTPRHFTPYDIIAVGGTPSSPLSILTGHTCRRVGCKEFQHETMDATMRQTKLDDIRRQLADAFKTNHLVAGGTADLHAGQVIVPGLYYNHSYGVLAYESQTDRVTFWNPMGNHFVPRGSPGLDNGYPTSRGRFEVPLAEAVMWFGSFSIETDEAAPP
jgi:hypothetical protein